jgi:acyl carrier protein
MTRDDIFAKVVEIVRPYVKNEEALANVGDDTDILQDLKVNSARLVDVILNFEDEFDIEVEDEDADAVNTVGDAVSLIEEKLS